MINVGIGFKDVKITYDDVYYLFDHGIKLHDSRGKIITRNTSYYSWSFENVIDQLSLPLITLLRRLSVDGECLYKYNSPSLYEVDWCFVTDETKVVYWFVDVLLGYKFVEIENRHKYKWFVNITSDGRDFIETYDKLVELGKR